MHDLRPPLGGAEVSILHLFEIARQRGIEVVPIGVSDEPPKVDKVVFSGLEYFSRAAQERLLTAYKPSKVPGIVWDHHVGLGGMAAAHWRRLFAFASSTIFVSPLHAESRLKQYDTIHDYVVMPVGVGPQDFHPDPSIERDPNRAVCMMSRILSKGRRLLDAYIGHNPQLDIHVYSEFTSSCPNVHVYGQVPRDTLPAVYNSAHYHLDLPCRIMAGGNATYEAVLCGCEPVVNQYVGAASWPWNWKNPEVLRDKLTRGNEEFWDVVVS